MVRRHRFEVTHVSRDAEASNRAIWSQDETPLSASIWAICQLSDNVVLVDVVKGSTPPEASIFLDR